MASIVLTGSSGMIGSALGERLIAEGHDLVAIDVRRNRWIPEIQERTHHIDLLASEEFDVLPEDPDYVIHFAANARVRTSIEDPTLASENIRMTENVLEYLRDVSNPRLVFASSREVYGETESDYTSEETVSLQACSNPYGGSKISNEAMIYAYEECYGISPLIFRFSNIYGKFDVTDRVIPLFLARAENDQPLSVYGAEKSIDFCYIEDCTDAVLRGVERFDAVAGCSINIGADERTTLTELARIITDVTDSDSPVHVESNREGEVSHFVPDIRRASKLLDYDPDHSIKEGIRKTAEWYRERPDLLAEIQR